MIKALLVEDEPKLREVLKIKLNKYCSNISIAGEASNIAEAYELIQIHKPDILFLDIAMPGGTGFDLLKKLETIDFEIIFVTGFNEYAIDALKLSAVDYLLKPVKTEELTVAVDKAVVRINQHKIKNDYSILQHNINTVDNQQAKIAIPSNDAFDFVTVKEIIRCEGWNKYTKIKLNSGKEIVSSYNIGVFKDMLLKYGFYSPHKSHIINRECILRYLKEGIIVMNDNSQVPLARRRKEEFLNVILADKIIR